MREVQFHTWCDAHAQAGEKVPGATLRIALGKAAPKDVDLCEACREDLVAPLAALVQKAGVAVDQAPAKAPKPATGPAGDVLEFAVGLDQVVDDVATRARTCPACGVTSKSIAGLVQHTKTHHDLSVRDLWGSVCPMCAAESGVLGAHAKTHGVDDVPTLFALAASQGDPRGVIAGREALAWGVAA